MVHSFDSRLFFIRWRFGVTFLMLFWSSGQAMDFGSVAEAAFRSNPPSSSKKLPTINDSDQSRVELEELVLKWTNRERTSRKLPRLRLNAILTSLAQAHSQDQAVAGLMAHNSDKFPKGRQTFEDRVKVLHFDAPSTLGENIFWTNKKFPATLSGRDGYASSIVQAWMKSPGHRKNILNPAFRNMGIGFSDGYVTQLFSSQNPAHRHSESSRRLHPSF